MKSCCFFSHNQYKFKFVITVDNENSLFIFSQNKSLLSIKGPH